MSGRGRGPLGLLRLEAEHHVRTWGGHRLGARDGTIGESWIVWENDKIVDGPHAGRTLADLTRELGPGLVGAEFAGSDFPLLIKLLDTREWLSVQVHPGDEHARELEGETFVGKTEAWHVLDADPEARIIAGLRAGSDRDALERALGSGSILDLAVYHDVARADTIYVPAGLIHALGPGLLVYEVQQSSDITYRVFDWDRPASTGRALHLEQTLRVADPTATASVLALRRDAEGARDELLASPYFVLERIAGLGTAVTLDTGEATFHALTATEGSAAVIVGDDRAELEPYQTILVPAAVGEYRIESGGRFSLLLSRLP